MNDNKLWAVVPAAGIGRRMGSVRPKQYLSLLGETVLSHTLSKLAQIKNLSAIVVALHSEDNYWHSIKKPSMPELLTVNGGEERCHSVYNALQALADLAADNDWVLVHDAARPCVSVADIHKLLATLKNQAAGGLLACKVADTVKRGSQDNQVITTVDRSDLWRALTPQVFRYEKLKAALATALESGRVVTDEAQALELNNEAVVLVEGSSDNIKITNPQDLQVAEMILERALA